MHGTQACFSRAMNSNSVEFAAVAAALACVHAAHACTALDPPSAESEPVRKVRSLTSSLGYCWSRGHVVVLIIACPRLQRISTRAFVRERVPSESDIRRIVSLATRAPSGGNTQVRCARHPSCPELLLLSDRLSCTNLLCCCGTCTWSHARLITFCTPTFSAAVARLRGRRPCS
jgi:hypothetical protein